MGGDFAPQNVIAGVVDAIREYDVTIVLVGVEDRINAELKKFTYPAGRIEIVHAPEVIEMHEPATACIRQKKNSSITIGINLLKEKKCDAFVSAGNTGACVAAATFILGMIPGVDRPGIGCVLPSLLEPTFM